ncbi:hypothetical protein [Pseudokineococcus lusitanus]|uniref:Uncharacterized protein n=1 Tax=Pseudokineococcus lusitanus TaxID=763993 RepID=A0A3N1GWN7_9ACTN|nr:hypothetical protein [Pseudokineococcus lusitanus]ROP34655.1 hypothetical protein EDC03_2472 [Pseudokineococcus lusitanus]
MTTLTPVVGAALVVLGVLGYVLTGADSLTALIPAVVGVLMLAAAAVARSPRLHRHGIHAALLVALLGLLGSSMNVVRLPAVLTGTAERPAAVVVSTVMAVLLLVYLVAGVRSFAAARRRRRVTP